MSENKKVIDVLNLKVNINHLQYRKEDLYYYEVKAQSSLFSNFSGFTNKKGIDSLKLGKSKIETFSNLMLLNKEQVHYFRTMHFVNAYDLIREENKDLKYIKSLNDENYSLYKVIYGSHMIRDLNDNILPLFVSLNNPLYLINNNDFNLEEVLEVMAANKQFVAIKTGDRYEKPIKEINGISIRNIPYYNAESYKDRYIPVGWIPTDENWKEFLNIIKENNILRDKENYIPDMARVILEIGMFGFEIPENKKYIKFKK